MRAALAWVLLVLAANAVAQDGGAVNISALRDPVDKSYRKMVNGMTLFGELHALAPLASLRYRLWPRKPDTDLRDVALSIVGDSFERPVAVAADQTFTLERDARALAEDASVRPNRKAGTMTWRADIRTPGLPADTRRLGDLRLECRVGMEAGLVSRYPSLFERLADFVIGARGFCDQTEPPYLFFAARPLFAVTLRAGSRSQTLSVGELYAGIAHARVSKEDIRYCDCEALLDRAYFVPLGDRSWPDDTLVELDYMSTGPAGSGYSSLAGSTKADVLALFGDGKALRFDNGFEIWHYEYGPKERRLGQTEIVVLFDRAGVVAKARLRPAPG